VIKLENISKYYSIGGGRLHVLKNVNLEIKQGEYIAIMGPSGSGKSTLLHILGLLDKSSEGHYYFEGTNTNLLTDDQLSALRNKKIGFVFQSFNLFPQLNIIENVEVPFDYGDHTDKKERAVYLLEKLGLGKRMKHKPTELSGGEMQRVAIARALVNNPDIIFADEPTGNLDEKTGYEILGIFDELNKLGCTIILITHNVAFKGRVKKVINIRDGNVY
jgi:putative ABC transport system ATP-binding protein